MRRTRVLVKSIGLRAEIGRPELARRFTLAFREAWSRIPLTVRRDLCGHWRKTTVPRIRVVEDIQDSDAWGSCEFDGSVIAEIRFSARRVKALSSRALVGLIAHELAHCHEAIIAGWLQLECIANQLMVDWGFWPELDALVLSHDPDGWPSRAASRRKILTPLGAPGA